MTLTVAVAHSEHNMRLSILIVSQAAQRTTICVSLGTICPYNGYYPTGNSLCDD
jgi:hypothetical protein